MNYTVDIQCDILKRKHIIAVLNKSSQYWKIVFKDGFGLSHIYTLVYKLLFLVAQWHKIENGNILRIFFQFYNIFMQELQFTDLISLYRLDYFF